MNQTLSQKIDWLYSNPCHKVVMTKKEAELMIDEVGTTIIVSGRLREFKFKRIIGSRYNVSTELFTK